MDKTVLKHCYDALEASKKINQFIGYKSLQDYVHDDFLRSAVERQFEILGEALNRIKKLDETALESIEGYRGAISFRNILAHRYDGVDNLVVWGIIQNDLPKITKSIEKLMPIDIELF